MISNLLIITIGSTILTAKLHDNPSVTALKELLNKNPLTIEMSDYNNMEKVGPIGTTLPRSDIQMNTVPGDIILYLGNSIAIYYGTNSWSLTPIAKIENVNQAQLKEILGDGKVTVTFSLGKNDGDGDESKETESISDSESVLNSNSESLNHDETTLFLEIPDGNNNKNNNKTVIIASTVSVAAVIVVAVVITLTCFFKKVGCFRKNGENSISEG